MRMEGRFENKMNDKINLSRVIRRFPFRDHIWLMMDGWCVSDWNDAILTFRKWNFDEDREGMGGGGHWAVGDG